MSSHVVSIMVCLCLALGAAAQGGAPVDARWRDLPHTDTVFVPDLPKTLDAWKTRREHLREQILWAAGLLPMPDRTPLNPQVFDRMTRDGYTVEKAYFESYPGFLVTGNLYRPTAAGKHPGVACPHGHWKKGRINEEELGSVPARCITLARLGCVVFAYDMVGYNDSGRQIANHRFTSDRGSLWGLESPLGLQLWNSIRVVDFLCSLPDVDPERIGCTGASGGGTQTFLLTAVDDRVKVSAPVNMISSTMQGGCVCENAPCLRFDTNNIEIGAMMAPRPMMMVSATGDWTKATPKVEFPAIRDIYKLYAAEDKVGMIQIDAPHNYNKASREAVYRWFGRWLLGRTDMDAFTEPPYVKEKDEDLLVFAHTSPPYNAVPNLETLLEWRIGVVKRVPNSYLEAGPMARREVADLLRRSLRLATGITPPGLGDLSWTSRGSGGTDGAAIAGGIIVDRRRGTHTPAVVATPAVREETAPRTITLLVHEKGKGAWFPGLRVAASGPGGQVGGASVVLPRDVAERAQTFVPKLIAAGHTVVAIDAFGTGEAVGEQDSKQPRGTTNFFTTFNRTDAAERVCDIVSAIGWCVQGAAADRGATAAPVAAVNVVGFGAAGPWCLLACATLEPSPSLMPLRVAVDGNGFDTSREEAYRKDLYVPGILKAGGLPAAAALVPGELLLHGVGERQADYAPWLKDHGAPVRLAKERLADEVIVQWLTR